MNGELRVERRELREGRAAVLLLGLFAAGCGPSFAPGDESFLLAKARAAVAFAEAEVGRERPAEPKATCDRCGGTGTAPSGDGLARVPCECGAGCRCEPAGEVETPSPGQPAPRRRRMLYFTASWCPTCRANEATFAALRGRGWIVGPGEESHVQVVDLDARADLRSRYGVNEVPAWVLIDGEREVRRRYGPLDPFGVGRLFDGP